MRSYRRTPTETASFGKSVTETVICVPSIFAVAVPFPEKSCFISCRGVITPEVNLSAGREFSPKQTALYIIGLNDATLSRNRISPSTLSKSSSKIISQPVPGEFSDGAIRRKSFTLVAFSSTSNCFNNLLIFKSFLLSLSRFF